VLKVIFKKVLRKKNKNKVEGGGYGREQESFS
jgi:hypothetical protein